MPDKPLDTVSRIDEADKHMHMIRALFEDIHLDIDKVQRNLGYLTNRPRASDAAASIQRTLNNMDASVAAVLGVIDLWSHRERDDQAVAA